MASLRSALRRFTNRSKQSVSPSTTKRSEQSAVSKFSNSEQLLEKKVKKPDLDEEHKKNSFSGTRIVSSNDRDLRTDASIENTMLKEKAMSNSKNQEGILNQGIEQKKVHKDANSSESSVSPSSNSAYPQSQIRSSPNVSNFVFEADGFGTTQPISKETLYKPSDDAQKSKKSFISGTSSEDRKIKSRNRDNSSSSSENSDNGSKSSTKFHSITSTNNASINISASIKNSMGSSESNIQRNNSGKVGRLVLGQSSSEKVQSIIQSSEYSNDKLRNISSVNKIFSGAEVSTAEVTPRVSPEYDTRTDSVRKPGIVAESVLAFGSAKIDPMTCECVDWESFFENVVKISKSTFSDMYIEGEHDQTTCPICKFMDVSDCPLLN